MIQKCRFFNSKGNVSKLVICIFTEANPLEFKLKLKKCIEKERNMGFLFVLYNVLKRRK